MSAADLLYLAVQDQDVQEHLYVVHCELRFCYSASLDQLLQNRALLFNGMHKCCKCIQEHTKIWGAIG